jgi:acetoin utilization deacetylase AcuC-like enzyme
MKLYYSDTFELPLPEKHRFPMAKYTRLRERILDSELSRSCDLELPPAATDDEILLVHTPQYLNAIKSGQLSDLQVRRIGFPWSPKMVERSRRSTGATIAAGQAAAEDGIAANLAGGTHHAFADNGQGYCVFNDACVAAKVLQRQGLANHVLIVDCDVHQGNGTAGIAQNDPSLFAFSMHCDKNYPFQKTAGDLDIALPPDTKDEQYLEELQNGLDWILPDFRADFVFFLAGADPFEGDRLGMLKLTKEGLQRRDRMVIEFFREREIPIAISMAGGYAPELNDIVDIHFATIEIALQRFLQDQAKTKHNPRPMR